MANKALITGLIGPKLTQDEKHFVAEHRPWGFIVFARNVESPEQLRGLTDEIRDVSGRSKVPIFVDQEGGRVQRLRPPHWHDYPSARSLGALYEQDQARAKRAIWLLSRLHAFDLLNVGLNVDCLPVLDVPSADSHAVIGDRAYGVEPEIITHLGRAACEGLEAGGVKPVIKHIPGHGRAKSDSHLELPRVDAPQQELIEVDFAPFKALSDIAMAMTAHVVFTDLDEHNPATTSGTIISTIIRDHIGFDGLLMSDDLSMKALSGDFCSRTRSVFEAGCDCVLHCNGDMQEMKEVADSTPELSDLSLKRADAALVGIGEANQDDEAGCRAEFEEICGDIAAV